MLDGGDLDYVATHDVAATLPPRPWITRTGEPDPMAEDFFCAVIETAGKEIVKRIPLEAY